MTGKQLIAFAVLLPFGGVAHGDTMLSQVFGSGLTSCASWTMYSPSTNVQVESWILGYFSGANAENTITHNVGRNTDVYGIIGEVEAVCNADPSEAIGTATSAAYNKMQIEGR